MFWARSFYSSILFTNDRRFPLRYSPRVFQNKRSLVGSNTLQLIGILSISRSQGSQKNNDSEKTSKSYFHVLSVSIFIAVSEKQIQKKSRLGNTSGKNISEERFKTVCILKCVFSVQYLLFLAALQMLPPPVFLGGE